MVSLTGYRARGRTGSKYKKKGNGLLSYAASGLNFQRSIHPEYSSCSANHGTYAFFESIQVSSGGEIKDNTESNKNETSYCIFDISMIRLGGEDLCTVDSIIMHASVVHKSHFA